MGNTYTTQFLFKNKIPYAAIPKEYLFDKELSLKAKGLLTIIYSLTEDWKYNMKGLQKISNTTEKTLRKLIDELITAGYIARFKTHGKKGHFNYNYMIFTEKMPIETWYGLPTE